MRSPDTGRAIADGVAALGQTLPDGAIDKLARLLTELERWNARINLTAIRDPDAMVAGHILDSLAVRHLVRGPAVIDVGTGAGFPGLPLAIADPGLDITLLDSNGKKISFVRHMIGELGITNATAVRARAESYAPAQGFDTVIARAFASLVQTVDLTAHLLARSGVLLALKGKFPGAELELLQQRSPTWEINVTELTVPGLEAHARHAIALTRAAETKQ